MLMLGLELRLGFGLRGFDFGFWTNNYFQKTIDSLTCFV